MKAKEIAQGALLGKRSPAILLAPGGNARQKEYALGEKGMKAIRSWLADGGMYMGFCGGAGLALRHDDTGLAICPWSRAPYSRRLYHMVSGHVVARCEDGELAPLPVWWPGRFAQEENADISILASYVKPAPDLWLADLPLARIPKAVFSLFRQTSGVEPGFDFPAGQPLAIMGGYGQGKYFLSYAHLETPQSPAANGLLASLLGSAGLHIANAMVPDWNTCPDMPHSMDWNMEKLLCDKPEEALAKIHRRMAALMVTAENLGLFFRREGWLRGWHAGLPGIILNHILAASSTLCELELNSHAFSFWKENGRAICQLATVFADEAEQFFWKTRMEGVLSGSFFSLTRSRNQEAEKLFGHPMRGGGMAEKLLTQLEELIYISQGNN